MVKIRTFFLLLCLIIFPFSAISGSNTPEDAIKARQEIMKYIGSQSRTLRNIQRGGAEFDPATAKSIGQAINSMSLALPFLFFEGSFEGETDSKQEILTSGNFEIQLENLQKASLLLSQVTSEDEFNEAFSQLGQTCSSCHREFRN